MNNETSYFLFQIISFKKVFYVSLGNNFLLFLWSLPPTCGGPGQLPSLPSLKSDPDRTTVFRATARYNIVVSVSRRAPLQFREAPPASSRRLTDHGAGSTVGDVVPQGSMTCGLQIKTRPLQGARYSSWPGPLSAARRH